MKKINKFGVITRLSTYIGCNNITTFFFLTPSLLVINFFESALNVTKNGSKAEEILEIVGTEKNHHTSTVDDSHVLKAEYVLNKAEPSMKDKLGD